MKNIVLVLGLLLAIVNMSGCAKVKCYDCGEQETVVENVVVSTDMIECAKPTKVMVYTTTCESDCDYPVTTRKDSCCNYGGSCHE
ncbi:MAG: hypothetical protein U9N42_08495 [Campylobacterota bacterium]|nr:hypothetical protein [Campylobacterota bacterium]